MANISAGQRCKNVVVRGGVEPPTFRFSGGADAQLSPITLQGLAVRGCARLALAARVAVTVAVSDHWAGSRPCPAIMLPVHCATVRTRPLTRVSYGLGSTTLVTTQRCLPILRSRMNPSFS